MIVKIVFNNMYVRGFGGSIFLLSVFQTRILSANLTAIERFSSPCHVFGVLKWSLCVHVCAHVWNDLQVTPLPYWLQSKALHLWEEAEGGGEFTCSGSHLESALFHRSLIALFRKKLSFFFLSPFRLIFHGWMEEGKVLLWINKDCLQLLHGATFAFSSFCVVSQELQPTIKPTPCMTPSQSWMTGAQASHASDVSAHG